MYLNPLPHVNRYTERILYMKIPFLASIIVFCIWLAYEIRKHNKKNKQVLDSYLEKEQKANDKKFEKYLEHIEMEFSSMSVFILYNNEFDRLTTL